MIILLLLYINIMVSILDAFRELFLIVLCVILLITFFIICYLDI
jgi:hypothetical protein